VVECLSGKRGPNNALPKKETLKKKLVVERSKVFPQSTPQNQTTKKAAAAHTIQNHINTTMTWKTPLPVSPFLL
jgi:hypothetical protein